MSSFERKQLIGKLIHEGGSVSVAWLAKRLGCSVATVRRDLSELEAEMKSLAVARGTTAWLLADAEKFKGTASVKYEDSSQFTTLYTDTRAAATRMTSFQREHKLRVVRCARGHYAASSRNRISTVPTPGRTSACIRSPSPTIWTGTTRRWRPFTRSGSRPRRKSSAIFWRCSISMWTPDSTPGKWGRGPLPRGIRAGTIY